MTLYLRLADHRVHGKETGFGRSFVYNNEDGNDDGMLGEDL